MAQPRTPIGWLIQAVALCLMAVLFYATSKPSPTLAADLSGFDHSPTCKADSVVTDTAEAPLTGPPSGRCVVQVLRVTNKYIEHHAGRHSSTTYWVTLLMPWGAQRTISERGGIGAYKAIVVGHPLDAMLWSHRVAFLAVNGKAISTSENPDVEHTVHLFLRFGVGFLLLGALVSLYRALVG